MAGVIEPIPGLIELLDWADAREIPYAAVTNAPRENAEMVIDALNARHRFETIVIADELEHPKPHPLPYLTGLKRLKGDPVRTVAFEDSRAGITSASAAGLSVIGLTTSLSAEILIEAGAILGAPDYRDRHVLDFVKAKLGVS